jgi:hypothetical protein
MKDLCRKGECRHVYNSHHLEYARRALNEDGFLVMGSDYEHCVGDIIDDKPSYDNNQRLEQPTVVIGPSTEAESLAQCARLLGAPHRWRKPFYYRVIAE